MAATVGPDADRLTGDGRHELRGIGVAVATVAACVAVVRLCVTSVAPGFAQTVFPADTFNLSSAVAGNRCGAILVLLGLGALFWSGLLMVATALSWLVRIITDVSSVHSVIARGRVAYRALAASYPWISVARLMALGVLTVGIVIGVLAIAD